MHLYSLNKLLIISESAQVEQNAGLFIARHLVTSTRVVFSKSSYINIGSSEINFPYIIRILLTSSLKTLSFT